MELFDYLELAYEESAYKKKGITLSTFIRLWLYENDICKDGMFIEIRDGKFYGDNTRSCEVDVENRSIKFFINKCK